MQQTIVLKLSEHITSHYEWVVLDANGQINGDVQQGSLEDFSKQAERRNIIAILHSDKLTLTQHELPPCKTSQRGNIAAYALEEQIAEPVENLHFAVSDLLSNGQHLIVWQNKHNIEQWQQFFEQHNLAISQLVPNVLLLPWQENTWSIVADEQSVYVKTGENSGFTSKKAHVGTLLKLELSETDKQPEVINVYGTETTLFSSLAITVPIKQIPFSASLLTLYQYQNIKLNLLQGAYKAKASWQLQLNYWRKPVILAGISLTLLFFGNLLQLGLLNYNYNKQYDSTMAVYQQIFPNAPDNVDPIVVFDRELQRLASQQIDLSLFDLLNQLAEASKHLAENNIQNISFENQQLTITIVTENFTELENYTSALSKNDINIVKQQSNNVDKNIVSQITIG